jgi:hypothetical protein
MSTQADLVIPRIFAAIDDRRFDDLDALYAADVRATTAVGQISGREQLVSTLKSIHEPIPVLQHLVTGVIVTEDGDTADVRANVTAFFGDEQHQPILEGSSIWRGRLSHVSGQWQIAQIDIESVWTRGQMPEA